ncbi:hypothetical protein M409DRAFT_27492 [Zasmidium cellare ATCC 36951]|uniref:Uncharacterized protein n=1 Tax=Zasmidium cellare ATCC 36951 TaxID=1080233 RepID=A0A6A6C8A3_ZASCE|nr:uncharacterized protein M409DRAFT_27492 [Zasmidium cellare ATCC 36951]KAF2162112.1 hypothetical protein M409DRAFT_27492 [Zasmidium cellare ATCC 36951]
MLQHVWISLMKSMQAHRAGVDPFTVADICQYRGSGLRELKNALPRAANDPYGIVLSCVMTMMTADLYSGGPWTTHLEASRRILVLNGGFKQCFDRIWPLRRILVNFIIVDVFSATMCSSRLIDDTCASMHAEYVDVLDDTDHDVFACSRPCPRQLIQAIARLNILRASLNHRSTNGDESLRLELTDLSDMIQEFDATKWAISVSDLGKTLPRKAEDCLEERDAMALSSYASCYHSATLLYFLLSCATPLTPQDKVRVHVACQTLSQHLRSLFDSAAVDTEGPLHTQLWKLLSWPIIIGMYVGIGFGIGEEEVEAHLERLRKMSTVFGSTDAADVTKFIYRVKAQRARRSATDWRWDDGFYTRCAFAL